MPTSDLWNVPPVMSWVAALNPSSVLDVGVGFGKYGVLCREVLELSVERYHKKDWKVRVEGIEVFESYRTPLWEYAYDKIHIGPVQEVLPTLGRYDLALFCDVIEHFEKEEGRAVLHGLLDRCGAVIVTTPLLFSPQSNAFQNEAERHLSHFSPWDFRGLHRVSWVAGQCLVVLASRSPLPKESLRAPITSAGARRKSLTRTVMQRARYWLHDHLPAPAKEPLRKVLRGVGVLKDSE